MYECKSCEREFSNEVECLDHEQTCKGKLVIHICAKCKTITTYWDSKIFIVLMNLLRRIVVML